MKRFDGELLDIFASNEYAAEFGESYASSELLLDSYFADLPIARRYCDVFFSMRSKMKKPYALLEAAEGSPGMYLDDGKEKPIQLWLAWHEGTYPTLILPQRNLPKKPFSSSRSLIWTPATATLSIPGNGPLAGDAIAIALAELREEYKRWRERFPQPR